MEESTMNSVIGLIDNGVFLNHFVNLTELAESISIDSECNLKMSSRERWLTHGTICASIIKKYAPNSEIISICLKPKNNMTSVKQLIAAIDLLDKLEVKLINISVGTVGYNDLVELKGSIENASNNGCVLVASGDNHGLRAYPSYFESVIGVAQLNEKLVNLCGFTRHSSLITGINYLANGVHELKQLSGNNYITPNAASFSTCYMTACIFNLMSNQTLTEVPAVINVLNEITETE